LYVAKFGKNPEICKQFAGKKVNAPFFAGMQ
jgi:hypothetical protein